MLVDFFESGGMNQLANYLFPTMASTYFPAPTPIIKNKQRYVIYLPVESALALNTVSFYVFKEESDRRKFVCDLRLMVAASF